jgi:Leucine-rich repeat (LRR) protein
MENLIYFLRSGQNFLKFGENKFINFSEECSFIGDFPILKKDYHIISKFFNKYFLNLEDVLNKSFELNDYRIEKIVLEHIVHNFPQELFGLDNLKYLDLSGGSIKSIPKRINKLQKLEQLYLDECGLEKIPHELMDLPNLKIISLMENNIQNGTVSNIIKNLEYKGVDVLI